MEVKNHRIDSIWHRSTSNLSSGRIEPKLIVAHYTTGWNGAASRDWLLGRAGGTDNAASSAHVVIDRDGTAWQIAPFNRRAWHAGPSRYEGLDDINSHGIGIEFVNPGWLEPDGRGGWLDPYRHRRSDDELDQFGGFLLRAHARLGSQMLAWPLYTSEQISAGLAVVRAIARKYRIRDVVAHETIDTRGWKTDPGPAFPLATFAQQVASRAGGSIDPHEYVVTATRLNLRGGPGIDRERIDPPGSLPMHTIVSILWREPPWVFIEVGDPAGVASDGPNPGLRGWVHSAYLSPNLGDASE
jgi:N-acetylmuramoyl-L-alanine amidase